MNKICGYNCEHNKGGICQITYCNKIGKMTITSQEPQILSRWQDPTIKELKKENERLNNVINEIESIVYANLSNIDVRISIQELLDKLKEGK